MITICAVCLELVNQISPLNDSRISHGLCRLHTLEFLERAELATEEEKAQLTALRGKRVLVQVLVPEGVAAALESRRMDEEKASGTSKEFADVAGMLLTRETHRNEWADMVPTT